MNENDIKRLALIIAIQAEIEGMKVANIERQSQGYSIAYDETMFVEAAQELRDIAKNESHADNQDNDKPGTF